MDRGLCDVDGVLADFTGYLLTLVGSALTIEDIVTWDIFDYMNEDEERAAKMLLKNDEFWRSQPVMEGAQEGFEHVRSVVDEMFWVTSPWDSCPTWLPARKAWLKEHFNADPSYVFPISKKYPVAGSFLIDDKVQHIVEWGEHNSSYNAFLFDAPYNQDSTAGRRMSWENLPPEFL